MRQTRFIAAFLAFLMAGVLVGLWNRSGTAKIEIAPETVDLGNVGTGALYQGTFVVRNRGRAPLEIALEKVSCSCTVTEMCESRIAPEGRGTITAYITASKSEGPFGSTISLKTNDPRRPEVVLKIQGMAQTVMTTSPHSLLFGDTAAKMLPESKRLVVRPGKLATPDMLAHLKVSCENACFRVEATGNGEEVDLLVTLGAETPLGAVRGSLVLSLDEFEDYKVSVPIVGCVTGDYHIRPTCLFFGKVAPGVVATRECHIAPLADGETLKFVDRETSNGNLLEVDVAYREGEAVVKAALRGGDSAGTYEDLLSLAVVRKDGGRPQHLQIPIIYVVADSEGRSAGGN